MYCPVNCPCGTQRDSEVQELKDQMQLIVHTLGIENIFKTHMRSEGKGAIGGNHRNFFHCSFSGL